LPPKVWFRSALALPELLALPHAATVTAPRTAIPASAAKRRPLVQACIEDPPLVAAECSIGAMGRRAVGRSVLPALAHGGTYTIRLAATDLAENFNRIVGTRHVR
jgi:hypothetical protein